MPQSRSVAAQGGVGAPAQILYGSEIDREGKGLTGNFSVVLQRKGKKEMAAQPPYTPPGSVGYHGVDYRESTRLPTSPPSPTRIIATEE